jgi:hypothetical protein
MGRDGGGLRMLWSFIEGIEYSQIFPLPTGEGTSEALEKSPEVAGREKVGPWPQTSRSWARLGASPARGS